MQFYSQREKKKKHWKVNSLYSELPTLEKDMKYCIYTPAYLQDLCHMFTISSQQKKKSHQSQVVRYTKYVSNKPATQLSKQPVNIMSLRMIHYTIQQYEMYRLLYLI